MRSSREAFEVDDHAVPKPDEPPKIHAPNKKQLNGDSRPASQPLPVVQIGRFSAWISGGAARRRVPQGITVLDHGRGAAKVAQVAHSHSRHINMEMGNEQRLKKVHWLDHSTLSCHARNLTNVISGSRSHLVMTWQPKELTNHEP